MSQVAQRAAGAAWWSSIEVASRYGVQFLLTVALARLLLPSDFGLVAVVIVFTSIGNLFVDSGLGTALIQQGKSSEDDRTTVLLYSVSVSLIGAGALVAASSAISRFFSEPELRSLLSVSALVLPLSALAVVPDAMLTTRLDFRKRTAAQLIASLFSAVLGITMAWRGFGPWSLVGQLLTAAAIRSVALLWLARWWPHGRFALASFRRLAGFGTYMLLSGIIDTILIRIQAIVLGRLFDVRTLGFYTMAQNAQQVPAQFIGSVLNRVGLPVFSQLASDPARMTAALATALRVAMFVFVPAMLGLALGAEPLVRWIYGANWLPAAPLLSILAIGTALWPIHVLNLAAISALGRSDLFFRLEMVKGTVMLALIAAACPYGAIWVAVATSLSSFIAAGINTWYSKRLLGFGLMRQTRDQVPTLAFSTVGMLVGFLVLHFTRAGPMMTIISFAASGASYVAIAAVVKPRAWIELMSLVQRGFLGRHAGTGP